MHRNSNGSRLVGDGSCNCLTNPPCRIGGELVAFSIVELVNRLNQTKIALLNQIQEQHPSAHIAFGNADYKTKVCLTEFFLSLFVTFFHSLCQFNFFIGTEKRYFSDFLEIHSDRVVYSNSFWQSCFDIDFAGFSHDNTVIFFIAVKIIIPIHHGRKIFRFRFAGNLNILRKQRFVDFVYHILVQIKRIQIIRHIRVGQNIFLCLGFFDKLTDEFVFYLFWAHTCECFI